MIKFSISKVVKSKCLSKVTVFNLFAAWYCTSARAPPPRMRPTIVTASHLT
jgi:hypothetical protein